MDTLALIKGLRFVDSFFPSGGFAFSSGLEAAVQGGAVKTGDDLAHYVEDMLRKGYGRREAVAAGRAHTAAITKNRRAALEADHELDAMHLCRETRKASRQMGRQVLRVAGGEPSSPVVLQDYLAMVESGKTPGHLPVALGLTLGALGWSKEDTIAGYLYQTAVGFVSAGLKLLPIGQHQGQRLLKRWAPLLGNLSQEAAMQTELCSWSPVQDIYAMRHSRLTSRLFRS